jgi:hypothetical protein
MKSVAAMLIRDVRRVNWGVPSVAASRSHPLVAANVPADVTRLLAGRTLVALLRGPVGSSTLERFGA